MVVTAHACSGAVGPGYVRLFLAHFIDALRVCLIVQATSALTHNISGTAKACVQTVLALLYFQNPTTPKNLIGIALVLLGSMFYTMVRNAEMEAEKKKVRPKEDSVSRV